MISLFIWQDVFLHKGSSSYQTIQNEQKVEDQNEDDCQAISLSTHPMAAYFQKQPSPADSDEELSQENNT